MEHPDFYIGREQSYIKHEILKTYLSSFAYIIGMNWPSITYVDGFSGPWETKSEEFQDSSFGIALNVLQKARADIRQKFGKTLTIRCVFVEPDGVPYRRLRTFCNSIKDVEVEAINRPFEDAIPQIQSFIQKAPDTFAFLFVDPKGWTGFSMETLAGLLGRRSSEVLINLMTSFVSRFYEVESKKQSFSTLFGREDYMLRIRELEALYGRDLGLAEFYCESLQSVANFKYVGKALVLDPRRDRTHHHLIYGTHDARGLEVFKEAERKTFPKMEQIRLEAKKKVPSDDQFLFDIGEFSIPQQSFESELRSQYLHWAQRTVKRLLETHGTLPYDALWESSLRYPLVWPKDVSDWVKQWHEEGLIEIIGLGKGQRTPKRGSRVHVRNRPK